MKFFSQSFAWHRSLGNRRLVLWASVTNNGDSRGSSASLRSTASTQFSPASSGASGETKSRELWEVRGSIRQQLLPVVASEVEAYGRSEGNAAADAFQTTGSPAVDAVRGLFIPRGYPEAVTPDYLPYQLVTFFTHIMVRLRIIT